MVLTKDSWGSWEQRSDFTLPGLIFLSTLSHTHIRRSCCLKIFFWGRGLFIHVWRWPPGCSHPGLLSDKCRDKMGNEAAGSRCLTGGVVGNPRQQVDSQHQPNPSKRTRSFIYTSAGFCSFCRSGWLIVPGILGIFSNIIYIDLLQD